MNGTTPTVFYGFGAFVGVIKGLRQIEWWPAQPASLNWNASALIATDLSKTPLAVAQEGLLVGAIEVDDHLLDGGRTRIGPRYPQGETVGIIWLAQSFYDKLPNKPPRHQTPEGADYELTSLLYWNGTKPGARYYGYRGKIISVTGTTMVVDVWDAGRGQIPGEQPRQVTLDVAQTDAASTQIKTAGQDGAIYIEAATAQQLQLRGPKRPEGAGR